MDRKTLSPEYYTAADIVRLLDLEPLDEEGGYFRRTGESALFMPGSDRRTCSMIYSLITPEAFSAMHRLVSDELWCFHAGDPLEGLRLKLDGSGERVRLGLNLAAGERPQDRVPAQTWQGTRLAPGGRWTLTTCVVVPEFVWGDFELGAKDTLTAMYPDFAEDIAGLTRAQP